MPVFERYGLLAVLKRLNYTAAVLEALARQQSDPLLLDQLAKLSEHLKQSAQDLGHYIELHRG